MGFRSLFELRIAMAATKWGLLVYMLHKLWSSENPIELRYRFLVSNVLRFSTERSYSKFSALASGA